MIDFSPVLVKSVSPVTSADPISVTVYEDPDPLSEIVRVYAGTVEVPYARVDSGLAVFAASEDVLVEVSDSPGATRTVRLFGGEEDSLGLRLIGPGFGSVSLVYIGGRSMPFFQASDRLVFVKLEQGQLDEGVPRIEVISETNTLNSVALFDYAVSSRDLPAVSGPAKAVVQFVRALLTTKGSSAFDPAAPAGNLRAMAGTVVSDGEERTLRAQVVTAVALCGQQLAAAHIAASLPLNERLVSATATGVAVDTQTGSVSIDVALTTAAGQQAVFSMVASAIESMARN